MARAPRMVGSQELSRLLGVSRQRVTQLTAQPTFPKPHQTLACGQIWIEADIRKWAAKRGRVLHD